MSIDGIPLECNPTSISISHTNRNNTVFTSSQSGGGTQYTSINGGVSPVRETVSFEIFQYPRSPIQRSALNSSDVPSLQDRMKHNWVDPVWARIQHLPESDFNTHANSSNLSKRTDHIGRLREADDSKKPVELEIVMSLPTDDSDPNAASSSTIYRHTGRYLVADLKEEFPAASGFMQVARVTLEKYSPPADITGKLIPDMQDGRLWMTFKKSGNEITPESTVTKYTTYTNTCALEALYDLLESSIGDGDNPADNYPPPMFAEGYYLGIAFPAGTETRVRTTETPSEALKATEYAPNAMAFFRSVGNVAQQIGRVINGGFNLVDTGLRGLDEIVETGMATVYPYVSTVSRVAMGVLTGGWAGLAQFALRDYPWAGNLISNIDRVYMNASSASDLGMGILHSITPDWVYTTLEPGLGYDPERFGKYFSEKIIHKSEVPVQTGQEVSK